MNMNEYNYTSAALELFAAIVTAMMLFGYLLERKKNAKTFRICSYNQFLIVSFLFSALRIFISSNSFSFFNLRS